MTRAPSRIREICIFRWGAPYFGGARRGQRCRVLWRGRRNSALVEWAAGGRDVVSRFAIRLVRGAGDRRRGAGRRMER